MNLYPDVMVEMSMPLGVNRAYDPVRTKNRAKIIKNNNAREWSDYAINQIMAQAGGAAGIKRFRLLIQIPEGNYDTDHFEKEIIDSFKKAGIIVDDKARNNMEFTVQVVDGLPDRWCRVSLWRLDIGYTKPCIEGMEIEKTSMASLV